MGRVSCSKDLVDRTVPTARHYAIDLAPTRVGDRFGGQARRIPALPCHPHLDEMTFLPQTEYGFTDLCISGGLAVENDADTGQRMLPMQSPLDGLRRRIGLPKPVLPNGA